MLSQLQQSIEQLYRLDSAPDITQFLMESPEGSREQLRILQEDDLYLGVSLSPALLARLHDRRLRPSNLDQFCQVVEGVSHYLCVVHRARQTRQITALELELQAEVDKYVTSLMLARRCASLPAEVLRSKLYDRFTLVPRLPPEEQMRYVQANALARRYTRGLERRYVRQRKLPAMLAELRRFYRLSYYGKQDLIQRAA